MFKRDLSVIHHPKMLKVSFSHVTNKPVRKSVDRMPGSSKMDGQLSGTGPNGINEIYTRATRTRVYVISYMI